VCGADPFSGFHPLTNPTLSSILSSRSMRYSPFFRLRVIAGFSFGDCSVDCPSGRFPLSTVGLGSFLAIAISCWLVVYFTSHSRQIKRPPGMDRYSSSSVSSYSPTPSYLILCFFIFN
jgi:hypothetical protein